MHSRVAFTLSCLVASAAALSCGGKIGAAPLPVTTTGAPSAQLDAVVAGVSAQLATCGLPGATLAIVQAGHVTAAAGIGVDAATGRPLLPSALMVSGQASILPLAVTALRLVEQGKLDLTRPVTSYVPLAAGPGFDPSAMTVGDLLSQTSGLPELPSGSCGPSSLGDWFASHAADALWSPPGAVWNFSHRNLAALAWVIEAASGQSFPDAVAARAFGPGGMTTATYDPSAAGLVQGAVVDPSSHASRLEGDGQCVVTQPADGVVASALDYANLAATLLDGGGAMLGATSLASLEQGGVTDYRHPGETFTTGLYREEVLQGVTALVAGSSPTSYGGYVWLVPDHAFAVAVLFNGYDSASGCSPFDAARLATATYLGVPDSGPDFTTPPSTWGSLVGTYEDTLGRGSLSVSIVAGVLTLSGPQVGQVQLSPSSSTSFSGVFGPSTGRSQVLFEPDGASVAGWLATPYGVGRRL